MVSTAGPPATTLWGATFQPPPGFTTGFYDIVVFSSISANKNKTLSPPCRRETLGPSQPLGPDTSNHGRSVSLRPAVWGLGKRSHPLKDLSWEVSDTRHSTCSHFCVAEKPGGGHGAHSGAHTCRLGAPSPRRPAAPCRAKRQMILLSMCLCFTISKVTETRRNGNLQQLSKFITNLGHNLLKTPTGSLTTVLSRLLLPRA